MIRYGVVGGIGFAIDFSIFNALMIFSRDGLSGSPYGPKVVSMVCALAFTYVAHSTWTFKARRVADSAQFVRHLLTNTLAIFGALIPLAVSRLVFRLDDIVSDNIAANGLGFLIGASLRFFLSKYWVFR